MSRIPVKRDGQTVWYDPKGKTWHDSPDEQCSASPVSAPLPAAQTSGPPIPSAQSPAVAVPSRQVGFEWRGAFREIPLGPRKQILDTAPDPAFAHWLLERLWELKGLPLPVPPYGYSDAQRQLRMKDVRMVFRPLKDIQRWCGQKKFFDLSAIIVKASERVPGAGQYGMDCADVSEWQEYMRLAVAAVAKARATGL
jgi:hypothetical protein